MEDVKLNIMEEVKLSEGEEVKFGKTRSSSRRKSMVWNHFNKEDPGKARCGYCKRLVSFQGGSTGNLSRHLNKHHPNFNPVQRRSGSSNYVIVVNTENGEEILCSQVEGENSNQAEEGSGGRIHEPETDIQEESSHSKLNISSPPVIRLPRLQRHSKGGGDRRQVQQQEFSEDEFDVFSRHIANQLRQLPLERALICQGEIHSMLTKERIELIRSSSNHTQYSSTLDEAVQCINEEVVIN